jgi:Zn-dependent M16 (insulinase) family peptidase
MKGLSPLSAVGQTYKDFIITKYLPIDELQSSLIELVHEPSGARVIHIANNDPENLFCLSFQTLPDSSNGVAHILEHTVLCGSKKFPVKDPFFAMTRRSLNTFMNALTGQDFTCYPASSQVEKDFYNLLEVYLDAVFYPELKYLSFLQEGHRFEFTEKTNPNSKIQLQGVVYNEMKGAMSSIESRLWDALAKRLTPDLPYAHNSGGDPKVIPSLTYEELLGFHREFYHPSRCLFFFYGNLPLAGHLDFILPNLEGIAKVPLLPPLPKQPRFQEPVIATDYYPIAEEESLEKKTQIIFSWLTVPISDQNTILALSLLETILTDTDASPLTKALLKSNLCTQVDSFLDVEMSEIPWAIVCKGCEEKDADKLQKKLFDTLKSVKISGEEIEAALHQIEFERTEINADGGPFGLTLFMRSALLKQHGSEPENALLIHTLFNDLRERIKDPSYLPNLIEKYLIANTHFVRLTLKPDPNLAKKEKQEEEAKLQSIQNNLSEEEKKTIVELSQKLQEYQESIEHQSLECLPKVSLSDVPKDPKEIVLVKKGNISHHNCFTNQILYADLIYELPELSVEELPLLSLFAKLLPELGAGGRSYEETLHFQQAHTGGLDASLGLHVTQENPDRCKPTFSLRGKALYRNAHHLLSLLSDFSSTIDLDDQERIHEWLSQHATEMQAKLNRSAMHYAVQSSLSSLSTASFIYDQWHGLPYYRNVLYWAKHCDKKFLNSLKTLADRVVGLQDYRLILTCDKNMFESLEKQELSRFQLPNKPYAPWSGKYLLPKPEPGARLIAAPVAFTAYSMRTISYNDPRSAYLLVAAELMKNAVLHKEIREKGGAYGSGATYTPGTGNFYFSAYRDPQLANTLDAFHLAIETLSKGSFNERELEEAKLGVLQTLDAPVSPANRAMVAYAWERAGRTFAIRKEFRDKVIKATVSDIAQAVEKCLLGKSGILSSFLGKEVFDKENPKLAEPLSILPVEK